jgi:transposase
MEGDGPSLVLQHGFTQSSEDLERFFRQRGMSVTRIGREAGPLSQWLHAGLSEAGFETVLLETRHVKAATARPYLRVPFITARVGGGLQGRSETA